MTACGTAHSHTRELACFDSVWEGSCGLHAKSVCFPTAHLHTRGLILSVSDGIRNMLFSTYSHPSKRERSNGSSSSGFVARHIPQMAPTAVCCASSTSNSSPADDGRGSCCAACSSHGNSRRLAPAARLTLQESASFCSCASFSCAIASKSHRIASGTWTRQLCASFQQASAGGTRGPSQPTSLFRAPSSRLRSLRT